MKQQQLTADSFSFIGAQAACGNFVLVLHHFCLYLFNLELLSCLWRYVVSSPSQNAIFPLVKPISQRNSISLRRHTLEPSWLFSFSPNDNLLRHSRCLHFSGMPISTKWVSRVEWSSLLCLVITLCWLGGGAVTQWQRSHFKCLGPMKASQRKTKVMKLRRAGPRRREIQGLVGQARRHMRTHTGKHTHSPRRPCGEQLVCCQTGVAGAGSSLIYTWPKGW